MKNLNEEIKENISNQNNDLNRNIERNISNNEYENNTTNIRNKNRKFIEEIFKYSEESNELIPIFKENSNQNIKEFFYFLIQILNDAKEKKDNLNEDEVKLICYNLRELKVIF